MDFERSAAVVQRKYCRGFLVHMQTAYAGLGCPAHQVQALPSRRAGPQSYPGMVVPCKQTVVTRETSADSASADDKLYTCSDVGPRSEAAVACHLGRPTLLVDLGNEEVHGCSTCKPRYRQLLDRMESPPQAPQRREFDAVGGNPDEVTCLAVVAEGPSVDGYLVYTSTKRLV
jgi:hypothetical protein